MGSHGLATAHARRGGERASANYCRACGDNLHCLEKRVWGGQCGGNPQRAMERLARAVERPACAAERLTWCSGKLVFTEDQRINCSR
jgi:hypothetical protein